MKSEGCSVQTRAQANQAKFHLNFRTLSFWICAIAFSSLIAAPTFAQAASTAVAPAASPKPQQPAAQMQAPAAGGYAGAEACKTCHENEYDAWEKSRHYATTMTRAAALPNKAAKDVTEQARSTLQIRLILPNFSNSKLRAQKKLTRSASPATHRARSKCTPSTRCIRKTIFRVPHAIRRTIPPRRNSCW